MSVTTALRLDLSGAETFLPAAELDGLAPAVARVAEDLERRRGPGAEMLGWLDLPANYPQRELREMLTAADHARQDCDTFVVIGIGGSYLGARAVLEALGAAPGAPEVLFAGQNLCAAYLRDLLAHLRGREPRLCVISKSGTTLEPALAFRLLRRLLTDRYGRRGAARRITAVTDARRGALRRLAVEEGYETFTIPDDVGGRFSVLTPVGLLPLAVAGVDIEALLAGAATMRLSCRTAGLAANPAHRYAAARHILYRRGFHIEVLSAFHSRLLHVQEWWKQLFGESEGKDQQGIFPAAAMMTTDLHSLGQYLQEGRRELFETFLAVSESAPDVTVPGGSDAGGASVAEGASVAGVAGVVAAGEAAADDPDGLDYLAGRRLDEINWLAYQGTRSAHAQGGVPCLALEAPRLDAALIGELIYFFEKAVAVGGRLAGVNPFDQPGVEAYKREMFRLLGRP